MAREVGTEGKLGGQAAVPGVAGTWKDLTDNVNQLAGNLTVQLRDMSAVATAIAKGDLTRKITVDVRGEILQIKNVINTMVDQLNAFASEVTRVAREVGTEGKLGGQANVPGVAGTWKDLTDSVNSMAGNLTSQVRNIARRHDGGRERRPVAEDHRRSARRDPRAEEHDQHDGRSALAFAAEVTRVAREVGTEGMLGGQANVPGVARNVEGPHRLRERMAAQPHESGAKHRARDDGGRERRSVAEDHRRSAGEVLELKNTINTMVDQLNAFAAEVTRVAREVGTEGRAGRSGERARRGRHVEGPHRQRELHGGNLTGQVRNIADVTTAVAKGDLSRKITVEAQGEILELKNTINTMVDQLNAFAAEVTRVAREVGTEGKLGGQANVEGVSGHVARSHRERERHGGEPDRQVRNIADVTTAVAKGDLSRKITVEAKGEILAAQEHRQHDGRSAQLRSRAKSRAWRAKWERRACSAARRTCPASRGTWKDLTDNVNGMATNLTSQVRNIAAVTTAVAKGDLSQKITVEVRGEVLELKDTINNMVEKLRVFAGEVTRVAREVGTEGRLGGQASVPGVGGTWKDLTDNVNAMAGNLTVQVRNIADVTTAVARGDLSRKITVDVRGEILELKNTINTMVDQLNAFAGEVTRVAREVGTEGKLGGQAKVPGAAGVWRDLTDNVNGLASNLTTQVRNIADVTTAVANGDLSQKITVEAQGEMLSLKNTINNMVDRLRVFGDEVTRVAKEVGTEGKLGGQAEVPGVAGTWKGLTDSVNAMANSLTVQVRNIADVATSVTKGDLTRQITVEAQGELDELKTNINQMIAQPARDDGAQPGAGLAQDQPGQVQPDDAGPEGSRERVAPDHVGADAAGVGAPRRVLHHGQRRRRAAAQAHRELRVPRAQARRQSIRASAKGSSGRRRSRSSRFCCRTFPTTTSRSRRASAKRRRATSSCCPMLFEGEVKAVIELASFLPFSQIHQTFLDQLTESIGVVLNMIQANMRTEELLEQSQKLTQELQSQSKELQQQQEELKRSNTRARGAGAHAAPIRGAAQGAAGRAAAGQRGARGEGVAARRAEREGRAEEPRGRVGARRARGKGGAAVAQLEVQERVPGEHVARAAHAAQLAAHPRQAADREQGREPVEEAGGVRADDLLVGHGSAQPDQRHSRSVEGRSRARWR